MLTGILPELRSMKVMNDNNPESPSDILDVSVVVCTRNAAKTIVECLKSIKQNNPKEIILVDAHSADGTQELARPYVTMIVEDPGLGLAVARNYGLNHAAGKYICNVGPDNILQPDTLKYCIDYLNKNNHAGVSTQTIVKNAGDSYLSYAMNLYKKAKYYPGTREVVGTPHLFITDILKKHTFDDKMSWSDDSDLCYRLSELGYTVGIADTFVYEIGTNSIDSIRARWKGYGLSDFEYYMKYSKEWKLKRKIESLLHPLCSDFLESLFSKKLKNKEKIQILPFLFYITTLRYLSWIRNALTIN